MQFGGSVLNLERRNEVNNRLGGGGGRNVSHEKARLWMVCQSSRDIYGNVRSAVVCSCVCGWLLSVEWHHSSVKGRYRQHRAATEPWEVQCGRTTSSPQNQLLWNSSRIRQCTVRESWQSVWAFPTHFLSKNVGLAAFINLLEFEFVEVYVYEFRFLFISAHITLDHIQFSCHVCG
jgi:hypothetical protein